MKRREREREERELEEGLGEKGRGLYITVGHHRAVIAQTYYGGNRPIQSGNFHIRFFCVCNVHGF